MSSLVEPWQKRRIQLYLMNYHNKMKKIFTLALLLACGLPAAYAQNDNEVDETLQFVDAAGTVVPDGSVVNVTKAESDPFGDGVMLSAGLFVKNTTDEQVGTRATWKITDIPGGDIQFCYPTACLTHNEVGEYTTANGLLAGNEKKDLMTEWIPGEDVYGTASVVYQLYLLEYSMGLGKVNYGDVIGYGPTITVNYIYPDPSGIREASSTTVNRVVERYNASGERISNPVKGVNILKMEDGSVRKVVVR